jgi:erythromycin esterase
MSSPAHGHAPLDDWIAIEAIPFALHSPVVFDAAVDKMMASIAQVELLGLGEALHGGEEILILRNRLFQRLAEGHGYSAIAIESSFPRARLVNEYVAGRGPARHKARQEDGFSQGFGSLDANRELVEWMREFNADPLHKVRLQFYGFDMLGVLADQPVQGGPGFCGIQPWWVAATIRRAWRALPDEEMGR